MNANNLFELVHQGFRVTVGAATSLVETLRDPQKREETLSELQRELRQRTQEWAEKGAITEREARQAIEGWLQQQTGKKSSGERGSSSQPASTATTPTKVNIPSELQELLEQIIALRTELEQSRQSNSK